MATRGGGRRGRGGYPGRGSESRPAPAAAPPAQSAGQRAGPPARTSAPAAVAAAPAPSPAPSASSSAASASSAPPPTASSAAAAQLARDVEANLSLQRPDSGSMPPRRPGVGKAGINCVVRANHFLVQVADRDYFQYDVTIAPEVTSKKVCRLIISELTKVYGESHLGKKIPAYDGRKTLYTAGDLPFESKEFVVKLPEKEGAGSSKRKDRDFKVTIKFAAKHDMHQLREFLKGVQLGTIQDTIQVLDVVLRQKPSTDYTVVGRSFFHPSLCINDNPRSGRGDLADGLEYWRGYYQSLRPTQFGLSLNIDLSARAFYDPVPVPDFVLKHFNLRDLSRTLSDQDRVKVKRALRGVKVEFAHRDYYRSYKITGISPRPANQTMFTLDDKQTSVSVVEYFHQKYNLVLKHPNLPCLQSGSDSKPVYIPMEVCKIVPGQRYTKKLNERQVTNLLRATCQRPNERESGISKVVKSIKFSDDSLAKAFGMTVNSELANVPARVLPPPKVNYHPSGKEATVAPRLGQWNMINKKMINGARVDAWACINFSTKLHRDIPWEFCNGLIAMCNSKGMAVNPEPVVDIRSGHPNQIEKILTDVHKQAMAKLVHMNASQKQLQLLIIILPDMTGSYGRIKRTCETELGLVSQCCQPRQAAKMSPQYFENVSLKINVKMGGRNSVLSDAISRRIPFLTDVPTIIFGADVTHPSPGDDSSPSIAAVVASMDWPEVTKYRGLVSAQSHREEIIQDLYKKEQGTVVKSMIMDHLKAFKRSTGLKPSRIIFYRDGVSEGQFSQVMLYEIDAIRKACATLQDGYLPPITFVVVQKRHHTRFFPENYNKRDMMDKSGNILPGTVVDTGICHPSEFDFYLNSHAGIQGTSRPAHYHVLYDENKITADALQLLTNNLCYTYARCTRAVSIVPPAYYAHLAAFRARYYIENDTPDGSSSGGRGVREGALEFRPLPAIRESVMNVMFFC